MTLKKWLSVGLVMALGGVLMACGHQTKDEDSDLLEKVKEKGTLVVALSPEFAPFEFKTLIDGKDTIVGSDIELAQDIADELGVELELSAMSFDNVLASLSSGKADLAISGISATAERAKVYDFSDSYYTTKNVLIVKEEKEADYASLASLEGQSIAVQKGSVQEGIAKENFAGSHVVSLTTTGHMIAELMGGSVEAVLLEEPIAKGYIANNKGLVLADISIESTESDAYAIAMPKGNDELKTLVNKVVNELVESGQYDQYVQEAFELSIKASQ